MDHEKELVLFSQEDNLLLEQLQAKRLNAMQFEIDKLKRRNEILESNNKQFEAKVFTDLQIQGNDIQNIKSDLTNQYEKISYQHHQTTKDYVGLNALGSLHVPKVGAQYMGTLLRKLCICKEFGNTEPKSNFTSGKEPLAINQVGESGYTSWYYHSRRTWELARKKLDEIGIRNDFESCKTKDEIHAFIKDL